MGVDDFSDRGGGENERDVSKAGSAEGSGGEMSRQVVEERGVESDGGAANIIWETADDVRGQLTSQPMSLVSEQLTDEEALRVLRERMAPEQFAKLEELRNPALFRFVAEQVLRCGPEKVFVCDDSRGDVDYIVGAAVWNGEETPLAQVGHTIHYDAPGDQGRAKGSTKILVPKGKVLPGTETMDLDEGLRDVRGAMSGIMEGKELYVRFSCLGPKGSEFSIPCVQLTDSAYVAHSEDLLYRGGYGEFKELAEAEDPDDFFRFVHSAGELDPETKVSTNLKERRVYMDCEGRTVYSINTQYAGNTVGLKKLAMRLAIHEALKEGWLCEHMLVMGVHGPNGRVTYITGAFPSMCGKTSTAMMEGETIVGDDIAYLRVVDGEVRAVNVESGMFGIIQGVKATEDPLIWGSLHREGNEVIFSNVLTTPDGDVRWIDDGVGEYPSGRNFQGEWHPGMVGADGKEIPSSHLNARFTIRLRDLPNVDPALDDPNGVPVSAYVYGGRDPDTSVPVRMSFDWEHGISMMGMCLESETTAATLGKAGVREVSPASNMDFLSIPLPDYIRANLGFGGEEGVRRPAVFAVNYFLEDRGGGEWLNSKEDKRVWIKWIELASQPEPEVDLLETPTGYVPSYEDLQRLFREVLGKEYTREQYEAQFTFRCAESLARLERVEAFYRGIEGAPDEVFEQIDSEWVRISALQRKHGDYVLPEDCSDMFQ